MMELNEIVTIIIIFLLCLAVTKLITFFVRWFQTHPSCLSFLRRFFSRLKGHEYAGRFRKANRRAKRIHPIEDFVRKNDTALSMRTSMKEFV